MSTQINFIDKSLVPIWQKLQKFERLSLEDGLTLYRTNDLIALGKMASFVQQQKSGDAVYFVINQKIEYTNVCILSCKFCAFAKKKSEPGAYELTIEEILSKITPDIKEVHITGAMPPDWKWERYLEIVKSIHDKFPETDIKAYTAIEIDYFHKIFKMPVEEILRQLRTAGLKTMPGGGAEIFSERVRRLLFNQKAGENIWLNIHKTAHRIGIPTNATMLYGHIETIEERLIHLAKLREAQDETGGFLTFVPLAFQPGDTGIKPFEDYDSAVDDLKTIAVSRLMLDNFPHIKAYWVMLTEEVASVALNFGADDIDGTVGEEHIAHDAGAASPMKLAKNNIIRIINDAGKIPVERDALYNPLHIFSENVIGKIPYLNSVPFYQNLEKGDFKILPTAPRRMGILSKQGQIDAGLFSLMDYFEQEEQLELMGWCIAAYNQVNSVILFSKYGWSELVGKKISITDDTSTSVKLLEVLLEKKYNIRADFAQLNSGMNDYSQYDAVLLIGDEALKYNKIGLNGFAFVFDLAAEWYNWQKLPFVFAVWAYKKNLSNHQKDLLRRMIDDSLNKSATELAPIGFLQGKKIGLTEIETQQYLKGFNYRLGMKEIEAMKMFRKFFL